MKSQGIYASCHLLCGLTVRLEAVQDGDYPLKGIPHELYPVVKLEKVAAAKWCGTFSSLEQQFGTSPAGSDNSAGEAMHVETRSFRCFVFQRRKHW